uniref:Uncharacterized protein n=1 Tax=Vombatus ursinus TaxID=29139 RepID=A0A4X2MAW2_VOMUR
FKLKLFSFPHCTTRLGFPRAHLPIVFLRYILHVFYYTVNNMLALTFFFFILFSRCLNLFCLALCTTCLEREGEPKESCLF